MSYLFLLRSLGLSLTAPSAGRTAVSPSSSGSPYRPSTSLCAIDKFTFLRLWALVRQVHFLYRPSRLLGCRYSLGLCWVAPLGQQGSGSCVGGNLLPPRVLSLSLRLKRTYPSSTFSCLLVWACQSSAHSVLFEALDQAPTSVHSTWSRRTLAPDSLHLILSYPFQVWPCPTVVQRLFCSFLSPFGSVSLTWFELSQSILCKTPSIDSIFASLFWI